MNLEVLKHRLSKMYHGSLCLEELSEWHQLLIGNGDQQMMFYGKLKDAIAREEIARSVYGLTQNEGKERGNVENNQEIWQYENRQEEFNGIEENFDLDTDFLQNLEKMTEKRSDGGWGQESSRDGVESVSAMNSHQQSQNPLEMPMNWQITVQSTVPLENAPQNLESDENKEVAEWRQRFQQVLSIRYAKSERIRFLFCRQMYGHYMERIRQINRLKPELRTCKEKRLIRKFNMDKEEKVLLDRNTGKPYLCYEDIFDAIYRYHVESGINEMRILFSQLKEQYANITFECVVEFFKLRHRQITNYQGPPTEPSLTNGKSDKNASFPTFQVSQQVLLSGNSSESEDDPMMESAAEEIPASGGKMTKQRRMVRSKYRNLFHMNEQGTMVACKLCQFKLTGTPANQTYQKIRNHIRYNHPPWDVETV